MTRVASSRPQERRATVKDTWYRPEKRQLHATIRWSLESSDALDEVSGLFSS